MSTANEVQCVQHQIGARMKEMQVAHYDAFVRPIMEATMCHATLGFFVRDNRSPKRLARLKQSLCDLTLTNLASWKHVV